MAHVSELLGLGVDAPLLIRPRDESSFLVPALDPSFACMVVGPEEADHNALSAVILDNALLLSFFVVGFQKPTSNCSSIDDGNWPFELDILLGNR